MSPSDEITNQRPSDFSIWHRKALPKRCRLADGDFFEVRENKVVAIEETIMIHSDKLDGVGSWILTDPWLKNWYPTNDKRYPLWETKKVVLNYLIGVTRLPFFIIYHTPGVKLARVIDYRKKKIMDFTDKELADWLQMLW